MEALRKIYRRTRYKTALYASVNWPKTLYFNFRMFPFSTAVVLPVVFFGRVKFHQLTGKIVINGPVSRGLMGFGQKFEKQKRSKGTAEFSLEGKLILNGPVHMAKDVFFHVGPGAVCEFGYMSALGSDVKLICSQQIKIGDWSGIGYESQVIDTNAHPMKNTQTGQRYPMSGPIIIGSHNAVSNRVSIMPFTQTPDFCVIASNTLCTKDYTSLGRNILIGGIPAKLLKHDYARDWEYEKPLLMQYKVLKW